MLDTLNKRKGTWGFTEAGKQGGDLSARFVGALRNIGGGSFLRICKSIVSFVIRTQKGSVTY